MKPSESLLNLLFADLNREYLENQKENLCKNICSDILNSTVNPNEMDFKNTKIIREDTRRYFVSIRMKSGFDMTVPVLKTKPYVKKLSRKLF